MSAAKASAGPKGLADGRPKKPPRRQKSQKLAVEATEAVEDATLSVALTFLPQTGNPAATKLGFASSSHSLDQLRPDPLAMDYAIWRLARTN